MVDWDKEILEALEKTIAIIRKDGPKSRPYCVYSETTERKFGCYPSRKQAEKRLKQIEKFKHIKGEKDR